MSAITLLKPQIAVKTLGSLTSEAAATVGVVPPLRALHYTANSALSEVPTHAEQ